MTPTLPLTRQPCTCAPAPRHQPRPCAVCRAWEQRRVLLTDGTTVPRQVWLDQWEVQYREEEHSSTAKGDHLEQRLMVLVDALMTMRLPMKEN